MYATRAVTPAAGAPHPRGRRLPRPVPRPRRRRRRRGGGDRGQPAPAVRHRPRSKRSTSCGRSSSATRALTWSAARAREDDSLPLVLRDPQRRGRPHRRRGGAHRERDLDHLELRALVLPRRPRQPAPGDRLPPLDPAAQAHLRALPLARLQQARQDRVLPRPHRLRRRHRRELRGGARASAAW